MIKGLVSEKARNWETICSSGGGLKRGNLGRKMGVASNIFFGGKPTNPHSFPWRCSKRGALQHLFCLHSKFHKAEGFPPVEGANTA